MALASINRKLRCLKALKFMRKRSRDVGAVSSITAMPIHKILSNL